MRVVFLGGLGRSGTTLVERLVGELPGVCPLGEVVHLWQRGVLDNERCGCGAAFHDCAFWREVGERAFGGWRARHAGRVLSRKAAVDRTRRIPELAGPRLRSSVARDVLTYARAYRALYEAVHDVTGCAAVIDSSKHASLAYCLRWCPDLDLRVLQVVRDSRGVAYSWMKRVVRPESGASASTPAYMPRLSPFAAAVQWNTQNVAFEFLSALGSPVRRVHYETVTAAPAATVAAIANFAGLSAVAADWDYLEGGSAQLTVQHTVSGNSLRFRSGRVPLSRDDAWRTALPATARRTVTALSWPLLMRYGYAPGADG